MGAVAADWNEMTAAVTTQVRPLFVCFRPSGLRVHDTLFCSSEGGKADGRKADGGRVESTPEVRARRGDGDEAARIARFPNWEARDGRFVDSVLFWDRQTSRCSIPPLSFTTLVASVYFPDRL